MASSPFEVHAFSDRAFYAALSNEYCDVDQIAHQEVPRYLYQYLLNLGIRTLVVENEYTDADFLDAFVSYYARSFRNYDRRCKRLHFFTQSCSYDEFYAIIVARGTGALEAAHSITAAYKGFVVARPLTNTIVGRTALAPLLEDEASDAYYNSLIEYRANLFGLELSVKSLAFQEQDNVLSACATVSLWTCLQRTNQLFGTSAPTMANISRLANSITLTKRSVPVKGLSTAQVCSVIQSVGLEPDIVVLPQKDLIAGGLSIIYGYLKLGVPVFLGIKINNRARHAIALLGYSLKKQIEENSSPNSNSIRFAGERIEWLYAHDDRKGPYSKLQVQIHDEVHFICLGGWTDEADPSKKLGLVPDTLIIPVYPKIRVAYLDVQAWLVPLNSLLLELTTQSPMLEWDLYLTTTNEYKLSIKQEHYLKEEQLSEMLFAQHPRFIWRALLKGLDRPVLEFLVDATDKSDELWCYRVLWHDATIEQNVLELLQSEAWINQGQVVPPEPSIFQRLRKPAVAPA